MKKMTCTLLLVIFTLSGFSSDYLFRIHVGTFDRKESPKDIRKVPFLKKYVLPESVYCFFSGGYFLNYKGAVEQLQKVKALGYDKAIIRVFKNEKLLTFRSANRVLEDKEMEWLTASVDPKDLKKQIYSVGKKETLRNRMLLFNEFKFPENYIDKPEDEKQDEIAKEDSDSKKSVFNGFFDKKKSKKENLASKKPVKEEVEKEVVEEEVVVISEEMEQELETAMNEEVVEEILGDNASETKEENNEQLVGGDIVFKVYLGSNKKGSRPLRNVDKLPEIVYTYEKKNLVLYTVGYYDNSSQAYADLNRYIADGFPHAKIVGLYKGIIVSERVALAIEGAGK